MFMFYILTAFFGFLSIPGVIIGASLRGNTLLYISACGYVISFAIAKLGESAGSK